MNQLENNKKILVISNNPELAEITQKAMSGIVQVEYASNEAQGMAEIRENHPEVVIIGYLEPPGAVMKFYRQLREGWISHHASLLVVELNTSIEKHRILTEENLVVGIGEYTFLAGATSPLLPTEYFLPRLREVITKKLLEKSNKLKDSILNGDKFCLVWEQIPGLGAFELRQEMVIENARLAANGGNICAISITDNPGGNPAIATDVLCAEIRKLGIEPIVHIAFRDRNRNQVESLLYQLEALEINNLLVLTGDYPSNSGFAGKSKPVFDLDSVHGLTLISEMNRGMEHEIMRKKTRLSPTQFFSGVAVSPFKQQEAEVMGQYYKLQKKVKAGANFVITQVGYDARKLQELKIWMENQNYQIPVIGNVYVLSYPVARVMHDNKVPGCVVTDKLLAQLAEESNQSDKGKGARLERAAKMYAIVKGLGYSGVYISGQGLPYENVEHIIRRGNELTPNWLEIVNEFEYPQENGFYLFKRDVRSRLNTSKLSSRTQKSVRPLIFLFSKAVHQGIFEPKRPLFKFMRWLAHLIDSAKIVKKCLGSLEYWIKVILYSCKDCGDCALFETGYLCSISQCPKNQRNGPCGGSYLGWCEVYPNEKQCIWVRVYQRLKSQGEEDSIGETSVPPQDWELWQTSSWLNYFLGRDHVSRRIGIKPPTVEKKSKG